MDDSIRLWKCPKCDEMNQESANECKRCRFKLRGLELYARRIGERGDVLRRRVYVHPDTDFEEMFGKGVSVLGQMKYVLTARQLLAAEPGYEFQYRLPCSCGLPPLLGQTLCRKCLRDKHACPTCSLVQKKASKCELCETPFKVCAACTKFNLESAPICVDCDADTFLDPATFRSTEPAAPVVKGGTRRRKGRKSHKSRSTKRSKKTRRSRRSRRSRRRT
jgi:hypothetical protein